LIRLDDCVAARQRIAPHVRPTPVTFDDRLGIWIKWENQQVTGSFKARGAFNKILSLTAEARALGLVACSAGNHGQGVALAAQVTGARATVYVPQTAARIKIETAGSRSRVASAKSVPSTLETNRKVMLRSL